MFEKGPFGSIPVLIHLENPHECNEDNATLPASLLQRVCAEEGPMCIQGMPENVCLCTSCFSSKVCENKRKMHSYSQ